MLIQATVAQLRDKTLAQSDGYIVIAMCKYPRGIRKELSDQYIKALAPDDRLFADFKHQEEKLGHDQAFVKCDYEDRFYLTIDGYDHLSHLADLARAGSVYLVCQCEIGMKCHRELLLLIAQKELNVPIDRIHNEYPVFQKRLESRKFINYRMDFVRAKSTPE